MTTGKVTIQNETGLHARPGNEFVTFIKTLQGCNIYKNITGMQN